ncbi:MAG: PspC domain-containing protein [Flavobacteriales bacterium]
MKRTVSANISGIIFHIEEDAYRDLEAYLKKIRGSLAEEEGLEEIMEDIEARIAELFKEATEDRKEVVTDRDLEHVMDVLGRPEDFSDSGTGTGEEGSDTERMDSDKRVYRDPDDKVLGGVCSGISAYVGWDPLWLRLAFALATLIGGVGPIIYILLWVIIPEARTRAEKLHMRGKAVNLDNLKKKMKEESEDLKDRFDRLKEEVNSEELKGKSRRFGQKFKEVVQGIFYWIGKGFEKLGALFLILFGLCFSLILFFAFGGGGDHFVFIHAAEAQFTFNEFLAEFIHSPFHITLFKAGFALGIGIPTLLFFYWGMKILFNAPHLVKGAAPVIFIIWLLGLLACLYVTAFWFGTNMAG